MKGFGVEKNRAQAVLLDEKQQCSFKGGLIIAMN